VPVATRVTHTFDRYSPGANQALFTQIVTELFKAPTTAPPSRWLTFVLGVLTAFSAASIDLYLPSLPAIGSALRAPPGSVQLTLSTFMIGMGIGQLVYGPASDRWGRRRPLFAGILLYVAASIACAWAPSIEVLIGARFVQAFGAAAGPVLARAIVRDLFEGTDVARVLSLMMLVMGVVPILAPLAGGTLLTWFGWRAIFGVLAVFGLCALTLAAIAIPRTNATRTTDTLGRNFGKLIADPAFVHATLAGMFGAAALFTYIGSASFVFMSVYAFSPQQFGLMFGLNAAAFIGASQLNRLLLARVPMAALRHRAAIAMAVASAVLVIEAYFLGARVSVITAALFVTLGSIGMMLPNATAAALMNHAALAGLASSLIGSSHFAMAAVVTSLPGAFHDGTARPMAIVIAVCAWLAVAMSARLNRLTRRSSATEDPRPGSRGRGRNA
jgi:DHA1 family bicyclomycin/chloramphenicol resistance-like MFS transporter